MRESIGGAWLFGIVIVFIFLFAGFLAYSVSYAKAFSTKNKIISLIEESESYSVFNDTNGVDIRTATESQLDTSTEGKIFSYMRNIGYNYTANINCDNDEIAKQGYCIKAICHSVEDTQGYNGYYRVKTFMVFEIPILSLPVRIPISGETRELKINIESNNCTNLN